MKEIVIGLLMWLSANSPLPWDGEKPPEIVPVPAMVLAEVYYNGNVPSAISEGLVEFTIVATYDWRDNRNRIYVLDTLDLTTLYGKSALLHESVHYLQYRHGIEKYITCLKELEPLAYEMEVQYCFEQGGKKLILDPMVLLHTTQRDSF